MQMYQDDDFGLAELREICLGLPDAVEVVAHGRPTFRTKKIFAVFGGMEKGGSLSELQHPSSVLFKPDELEIRLLLREERFFLPAYYGPYGWVGLDFTTAEVDWDEVRDLVVDSYRNTAPPRLRRAMDERDRRSGEG